MSDVLRDSVSSALSGRLVCIVLACVLVSSCGSKKPMQLEDARALKKDLEQGNSTAEEKAPADPLDREISLSFEFEPLGSVLRSITVLSSVDISVHPEVMAPEELDKVTVSIDVEDMKLRHVLDWLVREIGAKYQKRDDGSVWITVDYAPMDDLVTGSIFVPGLYAEEEEVDLIAILNSAIYPVRLKRNDITFTPRTDTNLLVVQAPQRALDRIRQIVDALSDNETQKPVGIPDESYTEVLEKVVPCDFNLVSLSEMSRKIREYSGLNLGYRTDLVQKGLIKNKIFMSIEKMYLREALDEIVQRYGFERWELEKGRGIWLYGEVEPPYPPSAEVPWHGTVVRAYPLGPLALKRKPEDLVKTIRDICGKSSPGTMVEYSAATGKLLVIDEPEVIAKVEEYLRIASLAVKAGKKP